MKHIITFTTVFLWVLMLSQPVLATDLTEPENVEIVDAWLTSDPQPGVRYHVLKVCENPNDSSTCTKCIYKAKENGAMWIPVNNRCLVRIGNDESNQDIVLYYKVKSVIDTPENSQWSKVQKVLIHRHINNEGMSRYRENSVEYFWGNGSHDEP